jgi:hypothetical protein
MTDDRPRLVVDGKPVDMLITRPGPADVEPDTRPHAIARRLLERQRDDALDDMAGADQWIQTYTDERDAARLKYDEALLGLAELDATDSPNREDHP